MIVGQVYVWVGVMKQVQRWRTRDELCKREAASQPLLDDWIWHTCHRLLEETEGVDQAGAAFPQSRQIAQSERSPEGFGFERIIEGGEVHAGPCSRGPPDG